MPTTRTRDASLTLRTLIVKEDSVQPNRRTFLGKVGVAGVATIAAGVVGIEPLLQSERSQVQAAPESNQRANECAKLRRDSAQARLQATPHNLQHPHNHDENLYPNK